MKNLYKDYTEFSIYLAFLISEGRKNLSSCSQDELEQLSALFVRQKKERSYWLAESPNLDIIEGLLNEHIITGDPDPMYVMNDLMKSSMVDYFYQQIEAEFDQEIDSRSIEEMKDNNMVATRHKDNGEVEWVKR
jgi:hypothetical protein